MTIAVTAERVLSVEHRGRPAGVAMGHAMPDANLVPHVGSTQMTRMLELHLRTPSSGGRSWRTPRCAACRTRCWSEYLTIMAR